MKILDIQTRVVNLDFRNCVLVFVRTDDGITGLAETLMKRKTLAIEQSILRLKSTIVGRDPTEIEDIWEKLYRDSFWVGGPMHATAISAVDCALWDILGKRCGVPVHKLHGGPTRHTVPVYCHCPAGDSPEEFARNARACAAAGYRALKTTLPLFYGASESGSVRYSGTGGTLARTWKETEYLDASIFTRIAEFFQAAREATGPEFGLAVDCHGRLGLKAALRLCRALENVNPMFVEEPVPPENVDVWSKLQAEAPVPIAGGERWATIHGVRPFVERQAVDILQCDLVNCGGFTGMKKIAALAEAHYIGMAPHNPNGPVATIMNLHFAASIPNFFMLETVGSDDDWMLWREFLRHVPELRDGALPVPCAPGYGIDLDEEALARHPYDPREGWR